MKKFLALVTISLIVSDVSASCGQVPEGPAGLKAEQVTVSQLEELNTQINTYINTVEGYQNCSDLAVVAMDAALPDYQTRFEDAVRLRNESEQKKLIALEQFNRLIHLVVETETE